MAEFLGRATIGFGSETELVLLQRKGKEREAPTGWSSERVERQQMQDLVVMSRSQGTWIAYKRWFGMF